MTDEERAAKLGAQLRLANHLYYCLDSPGMTDYEYDLMMRELSDIEERNPDLVTPDSPTQTVGCHHEAAK